MKTEDYNKSGPHRRSRRVIGFLLVLLMIGGTSRLFIIHRPQPLLDRASVALAFKAPWHHLNLNYGVPVIATLSDTNWLVGQLDPGDSEEIRYGMDRMELNPQRRFANARLASVLNQNGPLVGDMESSPDGKWVAGTLVKDAYPFAPLQRVASSIDGSRVRRWFAAPANDPALSSSGRVFGSYIAWMPDSQNVADITADQSPSGTLRLQGSCMRSSVKTILPCRNACAAFG